MLAHHIRSARCQPLENARSAATAAIEGRFAACAATARDRSRAASRALARTGR